MVSILKLQTLKEETNNTAHAFSASSCFAGSC